MALTEIGKTDRVNIVHPRALSKAHRMYPWILPRDKGEGGFEEHVKLDSRAFRRTADISGEARAHLRKIIFALRSIGINSAFDPNSRHNERVTALGIGRADDIDTLMGADLHPMQVAIGGGLRILAEPVSAFFTSTSQRVILPRDVFVYPLKWDMQVKRVLGATAKFSTMLVQRPGFGDLPFARKHINLATHFGMSLPRLLLQNEAQILAQLGEDDIEDRFVPQVLEPQDEYIDMEYIGDEIFQAIMERAHETHWKDKSTHEKAAFFKNICQAFAQWVRHINLAHEKGVLIRDVKPGNVGIMQDTHGRWIVKLIDFGLSLSEETPDRLREWKSGSTDFMVIELEQRDGQVIQSGDRRRDLVAPIITFMCLMISLTEGISFEEAHAKLKVAVEEPNSGRTFEFFSLEKARAYLSSDAYNRRPGLWSRMSDMLIYGVQKPDSGLEAENIAQRFDRMESNAESLGLLR